MSAYPLFIDYRRGIPVQSAKSSIAMPLRAFVQGDGAPISFTLLDWNGVGVAPAVSGENAYQTRAVGGYSLKVGLYTAAGSELAFQNAWTDDTQNNTKTGALIQNSANVTAALGSSLEVDCYLEAEISTDGATYETVLPATPAKLKKQFITVLAVTVPPNETPLTVEAGDGRYPKAVDCLGIWFLNPTTGQRALFGLQDNGTFGPGT